MYNFISSTTFMDAILKSSAIDSIAEAIAIIQAIAIIILSLLHICHDVAKRLLCVAVELAVRRNTHADLAVKDYYATMVT